MASADTAPIGAGVGQDPERFHGSGPGPSFGEAGDGLPSAYLSLAVLALVVLVPAGTVAVDLFQHREDLRGVLLVLAAFLNLVHTSPRLPLLMGLRDMPGGREARHFNSPHWATTGAVLFATAAMFLSGRHNPFGFQSWYWFPAIAMAVLQLRWLWATLVVCGAVVVNFLHQCQFYSIATNLPGLAGHVAEAGLVTVCTAAVAEAERRRRRLRKVSEDLFAAQTQLSDQAREMTRVATAAERARLCREVHDAIGHCLSVVGVQLEVAAAFLDERPEVTREAIEKARLSNQSGLEEMRLTLSSMRAAAVEAHTLPEALRTLATRTARPDFTVSVECPGQVDRLPPLVEATLFRCAQEGLTNASRHSRATMVRLRLDRLQPEVITLSISDNGDGFPENLRQDGGLSGMKDRVCLLGGKLNIHHSHAGGARLEIELPTPPDDSLPR